MTEQGPIKITAEFPGAWLKWVHVAEPAFERAHLNLDSYNISVMEQGESVIVMLEGLDSAKGARGNTGSVPGYEVEISKADKRIVRSNYTR